MKSEFRGRLLHDRAGEFDARVLVIDDQSDVRAMISIVLRINHFEIVEAASAAAALKAFEEQSFDLAIVDIFLQGTNGSDLIGTLRERSAGFAGGGDIRNDGAGLPVGIARSVGCRLPAKAVSSTRPDARGRGGARFGAAAGSRGAVAYRSARRSVAAS